MIGMTKSKKTIVSMSDEIRDAIDEYCARNDITVSDLLRNAALKEIGRKDLIGTMRGRGQPKKMPAKKNTSFVNGKKSRQIAGH